jgi:hypothetical protein
VTGPGWLIAVAAGALLVLAALILVDKRWPLRHLDDQPAPPEVERTWLGDGDLNHITDERIAAETRLHRRLQ